MSEYKLTFKTKQLAIILGANEILPDVINDKKLIDFNNWFNQADKKGDIETCEKWNEAFNKQLLKNCKEPLRIDTNNILEKKIEQAQSESELIEVLKNWEERSL